MKAHVSEEKKAKVAELTSLISKYPIVGIIDMENLPASQLQAIIKKVRSNIKVVMTKKRLLKIIFNNCEKEKPNIISLISEMKGMPALILANENPFLIFKLLKKNMSPAPAKAGQTAPFDIKIPAGPTPFAPGPVISELSSIGLKTGVENGKVAIKEEAVVVKEGEVIKPKVAEILTRLDIKPMKVGLNIVAIYENGMILKKDVLDIDEDKFIADLEKACRDAFNLGIEAGIINSITLVPMIQKAFRNSKALALEQDILTDLTVGNVLAKAEAQINSLKNIANIDTTKVNEESKPEEKIEAPVEKPAEESKAPAEPKAEEPKPDSAEPKQEEAQTEPKSEPETQA